MIDRQHAAPVTPAQRRRQKALEHLLQAVRIINEDDELVQLEIAVRVVSTHERFTLAEVVELLAESSVKPPPKWVPDPSEDLVVCPHSG